MKIEVNWEVNVESGYETFTLEDLGCNSEEEWEEYSQEQQQDMLQSALDSLPDQPFKCVISWDNN